MTAPDPLVQHTFEDRIAFEEGEPEPEVPHFRDVCRCGRVRGSISHDVAEKAAGRDWQKHTLQ